jgi:hypothetical protein
MSEARMIRVRFGNPEHEDAPQGHRAAELALEFCERSVPDLNLSRWLRCQSVDAAHALKVMGPIVEHKVIIRNGRFDFADDGTAEAVRAVVHIAKGEDADTPVDLIAWTRAQPCRVFQCLGTAEALGVDQIGNPASWFLGKPLVVHRCPLDWLRAGCTGIVILDPRRVHTRLESLPACPAGYRIVAAGLEHGRASAAEVFQTYNKAGTGADAALKESAVVCSLALQFGVPLDTFRHALLRNGRGVASSPLGCALDILADAGR